MLVVEGKRGTRWWLNVFRILDSVGWSSRSVLKVEAAADRKMPYNLIARTRTHTHMRATLIHVEGTATTWELGATVDIGECCIFFMVWKLQEKDARAWRVKENDCGENLKVVLVLKVAHTSSASWECQAIRWTARNEEGGGAEATEQLSSSNVTLCYSLLETQQEIILKITTKICKYIP
jgi:hypothetical protein